MQKEITTFVIFLGNSKSKYLLDRLREPSCDVLIRNHCSKCFIENSLFVHSYSKSIYYTTLCLGWYSNHLHNDLAITHTKLNWCIFRFLKLSNQSLIWLN